MRPLRGLQETRVATREESGVLGFPSRRGLTPRGSDGKESACNARNPGLMPGLERSPGGERTRDCSPGHAGKEGPQLARTGAGNPFQTTQGNRLSCRDQEGPKVLSIDPVFFYTITYFIILHAMYDDLKITLFVVNLLHPTLEVFESRYGSIYHSSLACKDSRSLLLPGRER